MKQSGTIIGERYRIEKRLKQGGYGITYLAVDMHLPSSPKCVVKQLSLQSNNPIILLKARKMFANEAKVLERLGEKHDQIPKLLGYFEEENEEFYLVQELIDGYDLSHEITPGNHLSENKVITLLEDILKILEFVHQQSVIHRDIKPSNLIRRSSDGKIVMIDFGAVKEISTLEVDLNGQPSITYKVGTFGYMPTEQENGNPQPSSDIYAVGMIAIQALTSLHPCNLKKANSGDFVWHKHAPKVSKALAHVLDRMVCQNFELRYQSATEALNALREATETTLQLQPELNQNLVSNKLPLVNPQRLHQNSVLKLSINPADYPFFIVLFLLLVISGFNIFQIIQRKNLASRYQSYEAKIDLNDVCTKDFIYEETDEVKNNIPIQKLGIDYKNQYKNVWPIFRWVCLYKPIKKGKNNSFVIGEPIPIGINLDKYCEIKYPDDKTKASHHDYNDPNSLYCTRPHP
ncbi:hypothetical protein BV372_12040 [Nostoc sp. T09]|uniref:serine/threonine-protein kinase n=1 Tax=Nostoc sp. T09 TaxID=1932621 RepID=UPI000A35F1D3|nr:serine/threonine-protein kinase [Nostoc sp. T09]OUL35082.1 hypothetical protein BV372_12040 [Nostoc sp. T09]